MRRDRQELIEYKSWIIVTHIINRLARPAWPVWLSPGGGQTDCLSVVDVTGNYDIKVNRLGSIHANGMDTIVDWMRRHETGLVEIAEQILDVRGYATHLPGMVSHTPAATACRAITAALKEPGMRAEPLWFDSSGPAGSWANSRVFSAFPTWERVESSAWDVDVPVASMSPLSFWWALLYRGRPLRLISTSTGQCLHDDGTQTVLADAWSTLTY